MTASIDTARRRFAGAIPLSLVLPSAFAQTPEKITVAESQGFGWAIPYLVSSRNLWRTHGVDASTLQFTSGRLAFDAALAGKAEFATSSDSVLALAGTNGVKASIVADFTRTSRGMVVAANQSRVRAPSDLKGKRVATTLGSSGHYFLSRYLSLHGLSLQDVTLVNLRAPEAATAVIQGDIDAFAWGFDAGQKAVADSAGKVQLLSNDRIESTFVSHYLLVAGPDVVEEKPRVVQAAVRALLDAEAFYRGNAAQSVALVADRTKSTPALVSEGFETLSIGVRLDQRLLDDLVLNARWSIEAGLARPPAEDLRALLRRLIHTDALRAAAPDRVTLA